MSGYVFSATLLAALVVIPVVLWVFNRKGEAEQARMDRQLREMADLLSSQQ